MTRLYIPISLVFLFFWGTLVACAQQQTAPYSLEWDVVAVDSIPGMTTARLYAKLVNPTDYLTSVSGWNDMEGEVLTTTSFYQHPDGWATPNNNNPLLFVPLPDLRWDSWVTIGIDVAPNGAGGEIPVGLFPPQTEFWVDQFEAGGSLVMDIDGAWFVTLGSSNGTAGDDLRVLVGQFTSDGVMSGKLNLQVFSEGVASDDFMDDVYSVTIPDLDAGTLSSTRQNLPVWSGEWGLFPLDNGGYRHHVDPSITDWYLVSLSGEIIESGGIQEGHFETSRAGIVVLKRADGIVVGSCVLR